MRRVYEAVEDNGDGVIRDWEFYKTQKAKLDQKLHMLQSAEVDETTRKANLPAGLLAGPNVYGQKWIYKLRLQGNVALRPMVCLGPREMAAEWTVLFRAIEKDRKLLPSSAASQAESRRKEVIAKTRDRYLLLEVTK